MITQDGLRYTIEELVEITGYSEGFIYNLTSQDIITSPVRGLVPGNPGKGVYDPTALRWLQRYKELRGNGTSAIKTKEVILTERGSDFAAAGVMNVAMA